MAKDIKFAKSEVEIVIEHPEDYINARISLKEYSKLSYVRKLKLEAYGYIVEGVRILETLETLREEIS